MIVYLEAVLERFKIYPKAFFFSIDSSDIGVLCVLRGESPNTYPYLFFLRPILLPRFTLLHFPVGAICIWWLLILTTIRIRPLIVHMIEHIWVP